MQWWCDLQIRQTTGDMTLAFGFGTVNNVQYSIFSVDKIMYRCLCMVHIVQYSSHNVRDKTTLKHNDHDILWCQPHVSKKKYGVRQVRWNSSVNANVVLTRIAADKSRLHAAVERPPCYTFVGEIFNGADQYLMSIVSGWNVCFYKTVLYCQQKRYVTRMFCYWKR